MNSWSRTRFESLPRRELSRGSHWKPSVWRVEDGEEIFAVKDASTVPAATRWFARWMMRRELRALRRVRGIPGVPQLLAEFGGDGYACTWLAGDVLDGPGFAQRPQEHALQFRALIEQIHSRGVFHLDLRQRQNILLNGEGQLACVDFGAAWVPTPPVRLLMGGLLGWFDRQAVLKWLARHAPEHLSEEEARSVLRGQLLRRLWFVSPHQDRGEWGNARQRLVEIKAARTTNNLRDL